MCGLTLDQFWSLTPREFRLVLRAKKLQQNLDLELLAWHAKNVMNVHLPRGKQMTIDKLLGRSEKPAIAYSSIEELKEDMRRRKMKEAQADG